MGSNVTKQELEQEVVSVERMEGEGGHPRGSEGDLGPITDPEEYGDKPGITTPRTVPPEEGYQDESVEGGKEKELVAPPVTTVRGCNCSCPGNCPEDCPLSCQCAGHQRKDPGYNVSGDEP